MSSGSGGTFANVRIHFVTLLIGNILPKNTLMSEKWLEKYETFVNRGITWRSHLTKAKGG